MSTIVDRKEIMRFPKPFMKGSELQKMGICPELLRMAYGDKTQRFAMKLHPEKSNSTILFNTAGLAEWMEKHIENQMKGLQRT